MKEDIDKIKKAFVGYQLFDVGGYVRDQIMGIESHDRDITTNANPNEMINLCKFFNLNFRYTKNSIAHGTVVVEEIEITTFRKELSWSGHNAVVKWAKTIEEDLSRRDFTCNAISKNIFTGEIIDPFNGREDIKNRIIRAVGNPEERLKEDTLRALRAIRFANRFGFDIEHNLICAIKNTDISNLSVERIRDEFMKILSTRNDKYIMLILYKVLPELSVLEELDGGDKHAETVDLHSLWTMEYMMEATENPLTIFAALIHDIGKAETQNDPERMFKGHEDVGAEKAKEIMKRMKFSNEDIYHVYTIIKNHMRWHFYDGKFESPSDRAIRRAIKDIPDDICKEQMITDLCVLAWADCQANLLNKPESLEDYIERRGIYNRSIEILRNKPEVKVGSGLEINGHDLIEMGFKPGVIFNTILKDVEEKVFNEELKNNKEELKKYIKIKYKV